MFSLRQAQTILSRIHATIHATLLVCRSLRRFVRLSVKLLKFLPKCYLNRITAPAHPYATDAVVYTALFSNRGFRVETS